MAELYEDWLVSPMTRAEYNELSDDEKKERDRLKHNSRNRQYKKRNPEKQQKYREGHIEEMAESTRQYRQTPNGKKVNTLGNWKTRGLDETDEELDIIYEFRQICCRSCNNMDSWMKYFC